MRSDSLADVAVSEPSAPDPAPGIPRHVAIIMDGNGRWANRRGLPRTLGHRKGIEAVRRTVRNVGERGIGVLTLFAFSRENWNRPRSEVSELMALLRHFIRTDLDELVENNVKITVIGARSDLAPDLLAMIDDAEGRTAANDGLELVLAFNYGGRDELARAARRAAEAVAAGTLQPHELTEERFSSFLDTARLPDPDLVIRTSGEQRISNFLLWQSAYAEYVFPATLWPDFDASHLDEALADFAKRQRRFGAVPVSIAKP